MIQAKGLGLVFLFTSNVESAEVEGIHTVWLAIQHKSCQYVIALLVVI